MIAGDPGQGGAVWAVLQYVLGLARLGHDVYLLEPLRADSVQPRGASLDSSSNAAYFQRVVDQFGLSGRSSLLLDETNESAGIPYPEVLKIARKTDILLNISGMLTRDEIVDPIPLRIYLDLDPGFNQLWHAIQGIDMRFAKHNRFVTVGCALGSAECPIPTCGLPWVPTFQPVVLEHWPRAQPIRLDALTSVANWRGYGSIEHNGILYGQKAHSVREFIDLPVKTAERILVALGIHPDETRDLEALNRNGWQILDPAAAAGTPGKYRQFVQGSRMELGIAKSGYVKGQCGWFSDRSACYLASGRPVIAQETGFSTFLPTGQGLFAFRSGDEAAEAIRSVRADYESHADAARRIAEEFFDSDKVLPKLLERVA